MELFGVLQEKNVSPIFLRTLLNVYSHQSSNVKWDGCLSNTFTVTNGVRQGAVSSPILFSLYIDELFKVLRFLGLGCMLNSQFYGCISKSGVQSMINKYSDFGKLKKLKFTQMSIQASIRPSV